jgi:ectoine hydroxylase-related dioxygenase (phytanoyl-CoA dioxygenase family)
MYICLAGVFECVDESAPGGGLWRRRPRLSEQQVRDAWAHDAHHDGLYPSMQTIWMLSKFDGANGGTRLLKDTWRERRQPGSEDKARFVEGCIPATGEPGDVLVYVGQTWHSEGVNTTEVIDDSFAIVSNFLSGQIGVCVPAGLAGGFARRMERRDWSQGHDA